MRDNGFGYLIAYAHQRIQGCHRLLEDHADCPSTELAHPLRYCWEQVFSSETDCPANPSLRRQQSHDGEGCNRFSAAGLAY